MTLSEFCHQLDELMTQAECEELPPDQVLTALEEWAEVQRGDLYRIEHLGRRERVPTGFT